MARATPSKVAAAIRKVCLGYPKAEESFPWGESAFKVQGKTFVFMSDGEEGVSFSVKVPLSRDLALSFPASEPTHYGLGSKGWVTLRPTARMPRHVIEFLVDESYRAVAPRKVVAALPEPPKLFL